LDPTRPITAVFGYLSYRKIVNKNDILIIFECFSLIYLILFVLIVIMVRYLKEILFKLI